MICLFVYTFLYINLKKIYFKISYKFIKFSSIHNVRLTIGRFKDLGLKSRIKDFRRL